MCGDYVQVSVSPGEHGPDIQVLASSTNGVLREHCADLALRLYRDATQWDDVRRMAAQREGRP